MRWERLPSLPDGTDRVASCVAAWQGWVARTDTGQVLVLDDSALGGWQLIAPPTAEVGVSSVSLAVSGDRCWTWLPPGHLWSLGLADSVWSRVATPLDSTAAARRPLTQTIDDRASPHVAASDRQVLVWGGHRPRLDGAGRPQPPFSDGAIMNRATGHWSTLPDWPGPVPAHLRWTGHGVSLLAWGGWDVPPSIRVLVDRMTLLEGPAAGQVHEVPSAAELGAVGPTAGQGPEVASDAELGAAGRGWHSEAHRWDPSLEAWMQVPGVSPAPQDRLILQSDRVIQVTHCQVLVHHFDGRLPLRIALPADEPDGWCWAVSDGDVVVCSAFRGPRLTVVRLDERTAMQVAGPDGLDLTLATPALRGGTLLLIPNAAVPAIGIVAA